MSSKKTIARDVVRSPKQLGQAVRNRRLELKLTQIELAQKIGSYQKTISRLEAGEPGIKTQTMFDVITALDLEFTIQSRSKSKSRIEDLF
ncbi:helix-turn-helix domain-containing protein [Parvibaculaceae bacterium PLY_AMNH_Bact1]|nr:helix-turn-helix domain-containing protein [Parvibaculaceae bacterium PLY_AMNH_Bact1]